MSAPRTRTVPKANIIRRYGLAVAVAAAGAGCEPAPQPASHFLIDHVEHADIDGEWTGDADPSEIWDEVTLRGETRRALTPPLASRLSFDATIPSNGVLKFAIGASTRQRPTLLVPIEFGVLVGLEGDEKRVFSKRVLRSQPNRWFVQRVDLSRFAGEAVRLTFETSRVVEERPAAEEHVLPAWGNPVLVGDTARLRHPHVVLISIDCLRADHLGAYGYEKPTSPRIDAFAREAVLFENVVAASSYTLPTHASMLTGLPPALHGATLRKAISPAVPYAPESLRRAGYRVNAVVSAAFLSQVYGFDRGFHTYRLTGGRAASVVDRALRLIDEGRGQAQFFLLHLYDIHAPYAAPTEFIDRFDEANADVSDLLTRVARRAPPQSVEEVEQVIALYDAEVAYVDQEIGRFFDALKQRGLFDASLIVLTADHGEAFYEHGAWEHGRAADLDKPGLYDEIVHIPLIVKWPGETRGASIPDVVSQMDVAATLLEAAGIESTSTWSLGLRRHVDGNGPREPRQAIAEVATLDPTSGAGLQLAFRERELKYIASFRAATVSELYQIRPTREELYDLARDPGEKSNLIERPGVDPGPFRAALRSYAATARELAPADDGDIVLDEALMEELRTLGYIDP